MALSCPKPRRFVLLMAYAAVWVGLWLCPVQAHVFKTSGAVIAFDRAATAFSLDFGLNLEAMLAGIDPNLQDTNDSPNAAEYNRLRALPPEALRQEFAAFRPRFLAALRVMLDGVPTSAVVVAEEFAPVGDLSVARRTTIRMRGDLAAGAKGFTIGWVPEFGKMTLRTISQRRAMSVQVVEPGQTSTPLIIDDLTARTQWDMIRDFMAIGFDHILPKGLDHILFVVGIFLLSTKIRPILAQVTAFTVAHTVTLGLGAAGVIALPSGIVEPLIAASIVYVAVENILRPTLSRWRPAVVFGFGLLHGLGFAGALREMGIPKGEFIAGLLSFNIGVELGQLTVIALCFLAVGIWFGNKPWYRQRIVIPASLGIAAVGAFWFVQRVAAAV